METTLYNGDKVLIDKTAYGIRLPITLLSIPFSFDNIFGIKSYTSAIQLPYTRFFEAPLGRNDIALFNNPAETEKPLDKRSLLISRCVALPGDTVEVENGLLLINKRKYVASPNTIEDYSIIYSDYKGLKNIITELEIPFRNYRQVSDTSFLRLNRYEAFMLSGSLPDSVKLITSEIDSTLNYKFLIPFRRKNINLDEQNLVIYKQIIQNEQSGREIKIENGKLLIDGNVQEAYTFEDDYYWMLSDNTDNSMDSKSLGFIPFKNIIGKIRTIWYNPDENLRSNRCFSSVK